MTSREELACVYSSLILFDDDISITAEKLQTILKTANVEIEPYWPTLFAKALEGVDIKGLITNISSGVGSGAPAAGGAAPAAGTFQFESFDVPFELSRTLSNSFEFICKVRPEIVLNSKPND